MKKERLAFFIMISPRLLQAVRCPVTHSRLTLANAEELAEINRAIEEGRARPPEGDPAAVLEAALLNEDRSLAYPIADGIVCLIADRSISLLDGAANQQELNDE